MSIPVDFVGLNTLLTKDEDLKAENNITNYKKPRLEHISEVIVEPAFGTYQGTAIYKDELGLTFNDLLPIPSFDKSTEQLVANHGRLGRVQMRTEAKILLFK